MKAQKDPRPFYIKYQKKNILVWPIVERKIVRDAKRSIYMSWWPTPDDFPNTPKGRRDYKFQKDQIAYRKFDDGMVSVERALTYAFLGGEVTIIDYSELQALAAQIGADLEILDGKDKALMGNIKRDVLCISQAIEHAQSIPMVESKPQLVYLALVYDKLGRVNRCALRCRMTAVTERFQERLENISFWSSDYQTRLALVMQINARFYRALDHFKSALTVDLVKMEEAMKNNRPFKKYLDKRMTTYGDFFQIWFGIKPFHNWIKHTLIDLMSVRQYLEWSEVIDAQRVMKKMIEVTRYKMEQQQIDKAIFILADRKISQLGDVLKYDEDTRWEIGTMLRLALAVINNVDIETFNFVAPAKDVRVKLTDVTEHLLPHGCKTPSQVRDTLKEISRLM